MWPVFAFKTASTILGPSAQSQGFYRHINWCNNFTLDIAHLQLPVKVDVSKPVLNNNDHMADGEQEGSDLKRLSEKRGCKISLTYHTCTKTVFVRIKD